MLYTIVSSPIYCLGLLLHILVKGSPGLIWYVMYLVIQDYREYPDTWVDFPSRLDHPISDRDRRTAKIAVSVLVALLFIVSIMVLYAVGNIPPTLYDWTGKLFVALGHTLVQGWDRI